ncbi:MAG TPA: hypothetical protein VGN55_18460 [Xanthobacteraceae bacterium]|jgi:hypothetical protein
MRIRIFAVLAGAMLAGLALTSPPASAKTVKECQKEWQADKVAMQAAGKTEKAYVAECRGKPAATTASTKQPPKEDKGGY